MTGLENKSFVELSLCGNIASEEEKYGAIFTL